jgi:hypothetical protein
LKSSAQSNRTKFTTLTQEAVRRLLNTSVLVPADERREIMEKYNTRMRVSGYPSGYRHKVITAAHEIYKIKKEESDKGGRPLYRGREYMKEARRLEKEKKRVTWYRKGKRNGRQITHAPLIINPTFDRKLVEKMRKICDETAAVTGIRVKVIERGGQKLSGDAKSDPLACKECGRVECLPCRGEKGGRCSDYGVTYRVTCKTCKDSRGKKVTYIGETGKSAYLRGLDHELAADTLLESNAIGKHCILEHVGERPELTMEVIKKYRTCLDRQEGESIFVRKEENEVDVIMNSRNDFHQAPMVRVVTNRGIDQQDQPGGQQQDMGQQQQQDLQQHYLRVPQPVGRGLEGHRGQRRGRGRPRGSVGRGTRRPPLQ